MPAALTRLLANPTAIEDELQRRSVSAFIQKAFRLVDPGAAYSHNWHIDLIGEYLEAVHRRDITRLIINIPPGYLKSISVNVAWPAWELGQNPSERIVSASYADRLSVKHSVDCRLLIQSPWYQRLFPRVRLTGDQNEKTKFMTTARGQRLATSVGRPLLLEGGMEWKEMGLSPEDLDFNTGMWAQAINICMALGVPSQLLGIPGSQTHANFEQAVET